MTQASNSRHPRIPTGKTTTYHYDVNGKLDKITDPRGHDTTITYWSNTKRVWKITRVTTATNDVDPTTTFSYNDGNAFTSCNEPNHDATMNTVVTDPNGHLTTYCFDRLDRPWKVVDAGGRTRSSSYTPTGDIETYTPATLATQGFNVTANYKTGINMVDTIVQQTGSSKNLVWGFSYDNAQHPFFPSATKDPQGNVTSYARDANGNVQTVSDPEGTTTINHDGAGKQVSSIVDGNGHTTTFTYGSAWQPQDDHPTAAARRDEHHL